MAQVLDNNETIGMAVRTVADAKPVFVSAGHKVDLAQAVDLALKTTRTHRLTEPVWHADRLSRQCRNDRSGS
jgi:deoxyribonuclease V